MVLDVVSGPLPLAHPRVLCKLSPHKPTTSCISTEELAEELSLAQSRPDWTKPVIPPDLIRGKLYPAGPAWAPPKSPLKRVVPLDPYADAGISLLSVVNQNSLHSGEQHMLLNDL